MGDPGTIDILNNLFRRRYLPRPVFFRTGPCMMKVVRKFGNVKLQDDGEAKKSM